MPGVAKRHAAESPHFEDVLKSWQSAAELLEAGAVMRFIWPETAAQGKQLENLGVKSGDMAIFLGVSDTHVVTLLVAGRPGHYAASVIPLLHRV